jgi:hypothetical protein
LASLGGLVAAAVLGLSLPVCAQPSLRNITPFGDLRGASNPPVARYVAGQGLSFTFDRSDDQPEALLKFDGSGEVWALQPSPGPGGVTIYRNDVGDPVVRVTRLGGVTLYTPRAPEGVPAALLGEAQDLQPPPIIPIDSFVQRGVQAATARPWPSSRPWAPSGRSTSTPRTRCPWLGRRNSSTPSTSPPTPSSR